MKKSTRKTLSSLVIFFFLFLQALPYFPASIQNTPLVYTLKKTSLFNPPEIADAAGLSSASATLSNPRLSYIASLSTTYAIGTSLITIGGTGPDTTTNHLFPGDVVGIGSTGVQNANLRVGTIIDTTNFTLKDPLVSQVTIADRIYATQSGSLTVSFYTANQIPNNGSIRIDVPGGTGSVSSGNNDGIPDTANSGSNGFDNNKMVAANITCPGGFTAGTPSQTASTLSYFCNWAGGAALPSGANVTVIIGNPTTSGGKGLVNPGPIATGHAAGTADTYSIHAYTYTATNGTGSSIDDLNMRVAPIEGVLVSANVDETLTFTIAGITAGTTCGHTASGINTTVTSVPWGTLTGGSYSQSANETSQKLTVTTNAPSGYKVYAEENDQMGMNGNVCAGTAPSSGEYTFGSNTCIRDFNVGVGATTPTYLIYADAGTTPSTYGLGYSLQNASGSDAKFLYSVLGANTYAAKHFADQEQSATEIKTTSGAEIMSNTAAVSGSAVYVCYRLYIPGTQPAGYYYNKIKYTAVPKF